MNPYRTERPTAHARFGWERVKVLSHGKTSHNTDMHVTLFLPAGRTGPDALGVCSEGQTAHLLARLKSLEVRPQLMHLDHPPPEFSSVGFQRLPAMLHSDGSGADQYIVKELEKYPGGVVNPDPQDSERAELVANGVYSKFCDYMRGADMSGLVAALQGLEQYLQEHQHNFLHGSDMSLLDCMVLPQLHEMRVVMDRVRGTPLPAEMRRVWMYLFHCYQHPDWVKVCPTDLNICLEWTEGSEANINMPDWLPQEHHASYYSFDVPFMCVCPARPVQ